MDSREKKQLNKTLIAGEAPTMWLIRYANS